VAAEGPEKTGGLEDPEEEAEGSDEVKEEKDNGEGRRRIHTKTAV
jgi:hypothetical protein